MSDKGPGRGRAKNTFKKFGMFLLLAAPIVTVAFFTMVRFVDNYGAAGFVFGFPISMVIGICGIILADKVAGVYAEEAGDD